MKKILFILLFVFSSFSFNTNVSIGMFDNEEEIIYCKGDECGLDEGVNSVKDDMDESIETEKGASEYIQRVVKYLLTFITVIAVIYIIYAGFKILISAGKEEDVTDSRKTIIFVLIGIMLIWLSYAIVTFIMGVLNHGSEEDGGNEGVYIEENIKLVI